MFQIQFGNKGISLVDLLVAIAIIAIVFSIILGSLSISLSTSSLIKQTIQANNIAFEIIEAVRNFRDGTIWNVNGLGTLATDTDYYPQATSSKWQMVQGIENINGFKGKVILKDVMRDSNNNIVESGGNYDPDTKKVIVNVSWQEKGRTHQVEITTYLTNWR
jgi:type II secretory pathway pseudopilin PulG